MNSDAYCASTRCACYNEQWAYLNCHVITIEPFLNDILNGPIVNGHPLHIWLDLITFRQPEKQDRTWNLKSKTWKSGRNGRPQSLGDPSALGELLSWHQNRAEGRGLICKRNSQPTALRKSWKIIFRNVTTRILQNSYSSESKNKHFDPSPSA